MYIQQWMCLLQQNLMLMKSAWNGRDAFCVTINRKWKSSTFEFISATRNTFLIDWPSGGIRRTIQWWHFYSYFATTSCYMLRLHVQIIPWHGFMIAKEMKDFGPHPFSSNPDNTSQKFGSQIHKYSHSQLQSTLNTSSLSLLVWIGSGIEARAFKICWT